MLALSIRLSARMRPTRRPLTLSIHCCDSGAIIRSVEPGSNADNKGVYAGYVLMSVNDIDLTHASMQEINEVIEAAGEWRKNAITMRFRPHATSADAFGWGVHAMQ
jgi:hypothetical protein